MKVNDSFGVWHRSIRPEINRSKRNSKDKDDKSARVFPSKDKITLSTFKPDTRIPGSYSPERLKKSGEIKKLYAEDDAISPAPGEEEFQVVRSRSVQNADDQNVGLQGTIRGEFDLNDGDNDVQATDYDARISEYVEKARKRVKARLRSGEYERKAILNHLANLLLQNLSD